jgi:DNA-binding NarL/FixJ family response regulator
MLESEFAVVDVAADGRALVKSALQLKPDGANLEVSLPQLNGIDAARELKRKLPKLKLIFFTPNSDVNVAAEAFGNGASAYLLKRSGMEEFMTAIRRVMRGESYLSPGIARETIDYVLRSSRYEKSDRKPTAREAEIPRFLAEGSSMKQVAATVGISKSTVAFHKYKMMKRLGIDRSWERLAAAITEFNPAEAGFDHHDGAAGFRQLQPQSADFSCLLQPTSKAHSITSRKAVTPCRRFRSRRIRTCFSPPAEVRESRLHTTLGA